MRRWDLIPDGEAIITSTSRLLPVRSAGVPAMLKVADDPEERFGAGLMVWWNGEGAARVLAHGEDALLLERATGKVSLTEMVGDGFDDDATRIICRVAAELHGLKERPRPERVSLSRWFEALEPAAAKQGGIFRHAAATAEKLLANPRDVVVLHGDLHHGNVLDFGERGWLAIDPKRLLGERTFDFVNLLRNPSPQVALASGRFGRQVAVISQAACLDRTRLLEWTLAFTCLSASWILADGEQPELDLAVADLAARALAGGT
ncbi:MAG: aminoglycoside phosphotransferase family protein [Trueperaceae bacterium]